MPGWMSNTTLQTLPREVQTFWYYARITSSENALSTGFGGDFRENEKYQCHTGSYKGQVICQLCQRLLRFFCETHPQLGK